MTDQRARLQYSIDVMESAIEAHLQVMNESPTRWHPNQIWRMINAWRGQIRRAREQLETLQAAQ